MTDPTLQPDGGALLLGEPQVTAVKVIALDRLSETAVYEPMYPVRSSRRRMVKFAMLSPCLSVTEAIEHAIRAKVSK